MKRLFYIFVFFFVALSAMAAYNLPVGRYIYFANKDDWKTSTFQFMIGHNSYSIGYKMTKINNTKLYYYKHSGTSWNGYTQWAVFGNNSEWGSENNSVSHRHPYSTNKTSVGTSELSSTYNLIPNSGTTLNKNASYTALLNKTHTIKIYVDGVESSAGGTVSASSYKLNSATSTTSTSGTTSIEAAYTATVTLKASAKSGYEFVGWYDNSDKELSTQATYSYVAGNSATTIKAKFNKLAVAAPQILTFTASATEVDVNTPITFTTTVENANLNDVVYKCNGTTIFNPWTPTEGGVYTITANLGATSKSVKVTVYAATIYFDNTNSGWSNVYAYCWDEGGSDNKAWPGVKLTNPVGNVYTYKSTKAYQKVIFTAGQDQPQTANLDFENGKTYSMPKPIPVVAGTANLCGKDWEASSEENKMEEVDGVYVKRYTSVPAGEHKFKVVYNGNWFGFGDLEDNSGCSDDGGNIQFTLDKSRDVIISFNPTNSKISLRIVYDNFPVGEKFYFTPTTKGARYAAYLFGVSVNRWVDMVEEYNAIYSFTMPDGEWDGLIYCEMKSDATNDWKNVNKQTADLRYDGVNNWFVENGAFWRKFEKLIFAGDKLYFKPDSNWESASARFAAYYWDIVGDNAWVDCEYNEESHVYEVVAPTHKDPNCAWTNIKFVRMNPATKENNFNKGVCWHQTPDLTYDGENDLFVIKLTNENDENTADPNNWISFANPFQGVIYLQPNSTLAAQADKRFSVYFWSGFGQHCWVKFTELTTHPGYYCAVVPEGYWTGANICSMNPATENDSWDKYGEEYVDLLLQTDNVTYHKDKLLYQLPESWKNNVPANECWVVLNLPKADDMDCSNEVGPGIYHTYFKRTLSISTPDDIAKWHWISLPYNVKISDITGGVYGTDFIIQEYDSEKRAQWTSIKSSENKDKVTWRLMGAGETLMAGKGYILAVSDEKSSYELTFVSESDLNVVADKFDGNNIECSSAVAENANWHLVGTGVYGTANSYSGANYVAIPDASGSDYTYHFLGEKPVSNFNPTSLGVSAIEPYTAFFVQYAGDYSFSKVQPTQNAAPRRARAEEVVEQYYVNIVGMADTSHTAIFLAEDGSDDYVVGQDFLHLGASGESLQFYSKQGENDLAFNYLKKEERTIALGGYVAETGKYTISLTTDGKASSVILSDTKTGEAIDLLQSNYEFDADKGCVDGRFDITIAYAAQDDTPTDVEIGGNDRLVVLNSDGIVTFEGLAIGEEVVIYDIMGRCVNHFVASNDVANVMLADGVYVMKHSSEIIKFVVNR